jgi:hypothetical protein
MAWHDIQASTIPDGNNVKLGVTSDKCNAHRICSSVKVLHKYKTKTTILTDI